MTALQVGLFIGWNLILFCTFCAAIYRMWYESRREPRAEWATRLRESILAQIEAFRSQISALDGLESRLGDLEAKEKRHFMSLSKQIRDNLETDDDEIERLIMQHVSHQIQLLMRQRQQVAPQPPSNDIPDRSAPIPGILENGTTHG